jgi:hypothetical protein
METRDGLIEFRIEEVEVPHKGKVRIKEVFQYRQCFKGIWTPWKEVSLPKGD